MAATVIIDKAYFETLLRRAEFHVSGHDLTTPVNLPIVSIPKVDHDNLLRMAQEYTSLMDALYRGGILSETLEILIRGDTVRADTSTDECEGTNAGVSLFTSPRNPPVIISRPAETVNDYSSGPSWLPRIYLGAGHPRDKGGLYKRQHSFGQDDSSFPSEPDRDNYYTATPRVKKHQYARAEQRTIVVKNLADRATHKDIVDIVRGGALLDIFLRGNERSASISFIEGAAAQDFMNYVKRNDIYIHGKRLEFAWNDRQFILPGHVANKIGIGATRNLVIRNVRPNITEERLRDDLDHIHNLIVINIFFQGGDAHLSLSSIHNSLFARTCMMSRATYKGMKIEWYPDECASPLPKTQLGPRKENLMPPPKKLNPMANRFQMLNTEGTEDGSEDVSEDDGEEDSTVLAGFSALKMHHRSPWNARTVVA